MNIQALGLGPSLITTFNNPTITIILNDIRYKRMY